MKLTQPPYLASAAAMTVGLYLLASPLRDDSTTIARLAPVWTAFLAYEFLIIGAIAALRRRGLPHRHLTFIALFFLVDPVFLSNSFASIDPDAGLLLNGAAWVASMLKALLLAWATDLKFTPWLAGWVSGALGFIHLFPSLIAFPGTLPVLSEAYGVEIWAASALAVPLILKGGRLGHILTAALGVHLAATGMVMSVDFQLLFLTPPLLATAILLPWKRFSWIPATAALGCSPLRAEIRDVTVTQDGVGVALVLAAFVLLGVGFLRSLASSRSPAPARPPQEQPEGNHDPALDPQ